VVALLFACDGEKKGEDKGSSKTSAAAPGTNVAAASGIGDIVAKLERKEELSDEEQKRFFEAINAMNADDYISLVKEMPSQMGHSRDPKDYPAKDSSGCNISPMVPPGVDFAHAESMEGPDSTQRKLVVMIKKKGATDEDWLKLFVDAGYKAKLYEPQSRYGSNKKILAIKDEHVVLGEVQHAPGQNAPPVSMALVDYRKMRGNMDFLLDAPDGFDFLGADVEDEGLEVAYGVMAKDNLLDAKKLKQAADELEAKGKADKLVAHSMGIMQELEKNVKAYRGFLKSSYPDAKHPETERSVLTKDWVVRFTPPIGLGSNWKPKTKGAKVFLVEFEDPACD
jgi:hypothetical protein